MWPVIISLIEACIPCQTQYEWTFSSAKGQDGSDVAPFYNDRIFYGELFGSQTKNTLSQGWKQDIQQWDFSVYVSLYLLLIFIYFFIFNL